MGRDRVERVWDVEAAFGVELPPSELAAARAVGELHASVMRALETIPEAPAAAKTSDRLLEAMVEPAGVSASRITPASRIVADLGINSVRCKGRAGPKMAQNLWWATGYNVIAIPLAAGGLARVGILLSPAVGAVLMSLSTVIVAPNAQLLRRTKL